MTSGSHEHRPKQDNLSDKCFYSQDRSEVQVDFGKDIELNKFELHVNDDSTRCLFIFYFLGTLQSTIQLDHQNSSMR